MIRNLNQSESAALSERVGALAINEKPEQFKVPPWLDKALRRHLKSRSGLPAGGFFDSQMELRVVCGGDWLDHWGNLKGVLVSEPYGPLDGEDIAMLLDGAKKIGASVEISATSAHYPTRTLRIELKPSDE